MASISCLILSDTHNDWPYTASNPAPKVDIFIHCGDLTQCGGLPSSKRAMDNINSVDAELKLFIAGNHNVDLDPVWLQAYGEDEDDIQNGAKCLSLVKSQKVHGTHYLDEGLYLFTLRDERPFKVYATPFTPKFGGFAFLYGEDEDRFNQGPGMVPEDVDILISHGPPSYPTLFDYKLDMNRRGEHCGCEKLSKALERARPRLACFGHIHEGRGAVRMNWADGKIEHAEAGGAGINVSRAGEQGITKIVLVNAAVLGDGRGWLVNVEL